jgi:hypothetical protein
MDNQQQTAFNAALAIFGSLLVPVHDPIPGPAAMPDRAERTKQFLDKAIEVLARLEVENHVLNRCIAYLRQLAMLVNGWSEFPLVHIPTPRSSNAALPVSSASSSESILELGGPSSSLHPPHLVPVPVAGDGELSADLLAQQPPLFDKSPPGFEDELELGHYFATEFQRWFGQFPT